jgi:aromatic acid exporter family member 1
MAREGRGPSRLKLPPIRGRRPRGPSSPPAPSAPAPSAPALPGAVLARLPGGPVGTTVRAVAQTAPATLTLVRRRAQPPAAYIARLTVTAAFAYLVALQLPVSPQPVLAPLTALLIVQATMYQTIRSALQRVVSVVAGVLVAVAFSALVGFTWWSLVIVIAVGLAIGQVLRLGIHILEVPISAMLILSLGTSAAATGRIFETLVGAGAGMLGGLIFAPLRVQPAEEAIDDLSRQLATLLDEMANDLETGSAETTAGQRLSQARAIGGEIQHVDRALAEAEESLRLNPRKRLLPYVSSALRDGLEALEHAATTVRGIARSIADETRLDDGALRDAETRECLASVLRQLAAAVRTFGRLVRTDALTTQAAEATRQQLETTLIGQLAEARQGQDKLADLLRGEHEAIAQQPAWPLHGELLTHLSRLREELEVERRARAREHWQHRDASWSRLLSKRLHPRHPPQG